MKTKITVLMVLMILATNSSFAKNVFSNHLMVNSFNEVQERDNDCTSFEGKWVDRKNAEELNIIQTGCESLQIKSSTEEDDGTIDILDISIGYTKSSTLHKDDGTLKMYNTELYKFNEDRTSIIAFSTGTVQMLGATVIGLTTGNITIDKNSNNLVIAYKSEIKVIETGVITNLNKTQQFERVIE